MQWLNRFRLKVDQSVVHEFWCSCPPLSRNHERMVMGALTNMRAECYLEDGVPVEEPEARS